MPSMDRKERPNHRLAIEILRRMPPAEKLAKAFELTELARSLFLSGLRARFPEKSEDEVRAIYLARLGRCRSRSC